MYDDTEPEDFSELPDTESYSVVQHSVLSLNTASVISATAAKTTDQHGPLNAVPNNPFE